MKKNKLTRLVGNWQPWDYSFSLRIERELLVKQANYFEKHGVSTEHLHQAGVCETLIALLDIILGDDDKSEAIYDEGERIYKDKVYINHHNAYRFINSESVEFYTNNPRFGWHFLREIKAWYLYNKLRYYQMQDLWD